MEFSLFFFFFFNLEDDDSVTSFLSRKLFKYHFKKTNPNQTTQKKKTTQPKKQHKTKQGWFPQKKKLDSCCLELRSERKFPAADFLSLSNNLIESKLIEELQTGFVTGIRACWGGAGREFASQMPSCSKAKHEYRCSLRSQFCKDKMDLDHQVPLNPSRMPTFSANH